MSDNSKIEWTDATWNPITGCSVVSAGCTNCYAMRLAGTRMKHHPSRAGLTRETERGPVWTGEVRLNDKWLDQPLRWTRPRRVFVCAHGDLFHPAVPDEWIDRVFAVMALNPRHVFQILTKRPERMQEYLNSRAKSVEHWEKQAREFGYTFKFQWEGKFVRTCPFPLPHVWLGVSVEGQEAADARIPLLMETPAAVRFLSCEPLLGPVDLEPGLPLCECGDYRASHPGDGPCNLNGCGRDLAHGFEDCGRYRPARPALDWVIVGGESGPGARPMKPKWVYQLRDKCVIAGVPFFFKQWGEWAPVSVGINETSDWDGTALRRVGKKRAGRELDGRTWDEMPREDR